MDTITNRANKNDTNNSWISKRTIAMTSHNGDFLLVHLAIICTCRSVWSELGHDIIDPAAVEDTTLYIISHCDPVFGTSFFPFILEYTKRHMKE